MLHLQKKFLTLVSVIPECYTFFMTKLRVGVLRGGPSSEYDVSLKTGAALLKALPEERYDAHDILIDRAGMWHHFGRPMEPTRILSGLDVVVNGLHGPYGEDGTVQRLLDRSGVPYTGSRPAGAALSMHKGRARDAVRQIGVSIPRGLSFIPSNDVTTGDMAHEVFRQFGPPYVVKPVAAGSSVGVRIVRALPELGDAIADALEDSGSVLVEELIPGREATVGVVDQFREQEVYALPPIEIVPHKGRQFFDYEAKYAGASDEICPGRFSHEEKQALEDAARRIHKHLDLAHYSRSDFIIHPNGRIYFLEANSLPGLTEASLVPKSLEVVGSSLPEFTEHLINLARSKR